MKEFLINILFDYEFIFIFLFCFIIFLLISIFIKQKVIRKICILFFSMFFCLFFFELILSFFMPVTKIRFNTNYINNYDINDTLKRRHTAFLIDNKSYNKWDINDIKDYNIDNSKLIFDKTYTVYSNNFRFTKCNATSKETYMFLGCSYTFGIGINDDETLPYYFSKLYEFKKNVINCAVFGQSINTVLNILNNDLFSNLISSKNSKINHCFYNLISDHIYRNFSYEDSFSCIIDGYLYKNNKWYIPTTIGKVKYIFARSYIFRKVFLPVIDEYFEQYYEDYMIKSLKEINKIVEEKYNSKLTIIVWPDGYGKMFVDKLKKTNIDLIFLPKYFNSEEEGYKIKDDGHPTAKANEEIAKMLYNHINGLE